MNQELLEVATGGECCCSHQVEHDGPTGRDRNETVMEAGNSMHVNVIGAALVYPLAFVRTTAFELP